MYMDADCTEIDLASWSFHFGSTGSRALAALLRDMRDVAANKIDTLSLAYNRIDAEGILELAQVLDEMPHLERLDLEGNEGVKNVDGLAALAFALQSIPLLMSLNLSATGMGDESMNVLAKALTKPPRLAVLSLNRNEISDSGALTLATAVASMPHLDSLHLSANSITSTGVVGLATALAQKSRLLRLDLSGLGAGDDGLATPPDQRLDTKAVSAVVEMLKSTPHFEDLWLNGRGLGDSGLENLARAFEHTPKLKSLALDANDLGDRGVSALATSMKHTPLLARLDLSFNGIGENGTIAIATAMASTPRLQELRLKGRNNHIGERGLRVLAGALVHTPDLIELSVHSWGIGSRFEDLAVGLTSVRKLEKLSLWSDSITHSGAEALANVTALMPRLVLIDLSNVTMDRFVNGVLGELVLSRATAGNKMFHILGLDGDTLENAHELADSSLAATVSHACRASLSETGALRYLPKALGALGVTTDLALDALSEDDINTDLVNAEIPAVQRQALSDCFVRVGKAAAERYRLWGEL